jgi:hypothetical protein
MSVVVPSVAGARFPTTTEDDMADEEPITVDCDTCAVRGHGCADCVVTVLMGAPPDVQVDADEQRALGVLADSGLVPPLRMVVPTDSDESATG